MSFDHDENNPKSSLPMSFAFMQYEYLERPDLFDLFNSATIEFYTKIIDCQGLKDKYFNGNFDNDIVFKAMIREYDPMGKMKKCISNSRSTTLATAASSSSSISSSHGGGDSSVRQEKRREKRKKRKRDKEEKTATSSIQFMRPITLEDIKISDPIYLSDFAIRLFLEKDARIKIDNPDDLYTLLKKLKLMDLLSRETIDKLVKIINDDDQSEEDMEIENSESKHSEKEKIVSFEKYLPIMRKIDPEIYGKVLKLFETKPKK